MVTEVGTGSFTVSTGACEGIVGGFASLRNIGLHPSGGRDVSIPSVGLTPSSEIDSHPASISFSSTSDDSNGENHWNSRDQSLRSSSLGR